MALARQAPWEIRCLVWLSLVMSIISSWLVRISGLVTVNPWRWELAQVCRTSSVATGS